MCGKVTLVINRSLLYINLALVEILQCKVSVTRSEVALVSGVVDGS